MARCAVRREWRDSFRGVGVDCQGDLERVLIPGGRGKTGHSPMVGADDAHGVGGGLEPFHPFADQQTGADDDDDHRDGEDDLNTYSGAVHCTTNAPGSVERGAFAAADLSWG